MNLFKTITNDTLSIVKQLSKVNDWKIDDDLTISVEIPKDPTHGDMATNVAMIVANKTKQAPKLIAEQISTELNKHEFIESANIAGPGFINITLKKEIWQAQLVEIVKQGNKYGDSCVGKGIKVNVEYVSTNPTGPMHIGHARGAVYGDALSTLLKKCQFDVVKEFYVNDAGNQIDLLALSVYVRYQQLCGIKVSLPEKCYPSEYIVDAAKILREQEGESLIGLTEQAWMPLLKEFSVKQMMDLIKHDLRIIGVAHEVFSFETELHNKNKIQQAVDILAKHDLIYRGILEPPKGKIIEEWEEREQLLFKSTDFGDDSDRPLQKSTGVWTYFAAELAYIKDKIDRGYHELIMVLGADHGGYVKRTKAACKALSDGKIDIDIKLVQMVNYLKDGEPLKMSKRAGNFVAVEDIVELVGKDVIRFIMLLRKNDMILDFDLDKAVEHSKDNPVFYIQYAHARSYSIIRNCMNLMPETASLLDNVEKIDLSLLSSAAEIDLIKLLCYWPKQVETAAIHREPHRIAFFAQQVAAEFHAFWNRGKDAHNMRFIIEDNPKLTAARLTLVLATAKIIESALEIIGVTAIKEM